MNEEKRNPSPDSEGEFHTYTILTDGDGVRADLYLSRVCDLSRSRIQALMEEGCVTCERCGKVTKKTVLCEGDIVDIFIKSPTPVSAKPEDIPLDIVYEDDDLLVINKPEGMVVHPAPGAPTGTLVNALLYYLGENLSGIGGELRPGIVHRIDKDTSGLLVVAKNDFTHLALSKQLETHRIRREYHALVLGGFREERGTVDAPIGRHPVDRKKMAVIRDGSGMAREAVTHYEVLEHLGQFTYLKLNLETGRTHQIRVHMASIGHPLVGDTTYGGGNTPLERRLGASATGQALHARRLTFTHPRTGEEMNFECPFPPSFTKLLEALRREYTK